MALGRLLKLIEAGEEFKIRPATLKALKATDEGAEALSTLKKSYDLLKLSGEDNFFAKLKPTDENIAKVTADVVDNEGAAAAMDGFAAHYMQGDVPGGESPIINTLRTSSQISGVTIPEKMLKDWQRVNKAAGTIQAKLTPHEFDLLPSTKNWDKKEIKKGVWHILTNPKVAFKELSKDLVESPTFLNDVSHKYGKHARGVWKTITKGLSEKERKELDLILAEGNDAEEVFTPVAEGLKRSNGDIIKTTDNVKEAYYGTRMLLDQLYWMNNVAAVRQARANGFVRIGEDLVRKVKGRHGEVLPVYEKAHVPGAKVETVAWNSDLLEDGWKVIEKKGANKVTRFAVKPLEQLDELHDTYPIIGYREGYVPVLYTDQWAIHKITKMADGTYRTARVATAPTRIKAQKAIENFAKKGALEEGELESKYVFSRKNDTDTDIGYGEDLSNVFNNLSKAELTAMKSALVDMGMDREIVESIENTSRFFSHKRNPNMMQRGTRLKDWTGNEPAPIVPATEAIHKYMGTTASYAANAEFIAQLEKKYLDEFGELLADAKRFDSPLKHGRSSVASNGRTGSEALLVKGQIDRIAGRASNFDRAVEDWVVSKLDSFAETHIGQAFNKMLDVMSEHWGLGKFIGTPSVSRGVAKVKGFTATVKLGMFNLSQAVVQGTAALNVIGKNPVHAAAATKDLMQAVAPEVLKIGRTKVGRKLWQQIDDSGFIAGVNYVELQRVASRRTEKLFGSRALRKLMDMNLLPYQLGEDGVRALAWFTERRILLEEMAHGLHKGLEEGSPEFLRLVNNNASITALNLSRVNQPLLTRGLAGIPLQFKQFLVQQGEFMFNPKNFRNSREMAGVWATWTATFGISGVPFMFDLGIMADTAFMGTQKALGEIGIDTGSPGYIGMSRRWVKDLIHDMAVLAKDKKFLTGDMTSGEAVEFWQTFLTEGALAAATDREWNIASRASLARVLTEYSGSSTVDDLLFGPGYQTMSMLIENNVSNFHDFVGILRSGDEFSKEYILDAAARAARGVPGIQHPLEAASALITGKLKDTEFRAIKDEPSLSQILLVGAGFGVGERAQAFERMEFASRQKEAWKQWAKGRIERIARMSSEGYTEYARVLFDDSVNQIKDVNPLLIKDFSMAYWHEMLRRGLDERGREVLYRMQDVNTYYSNFDKFQFGRDANMNWDVK